MNYNDNINNGVPIQNQIKIVINNRFWKKKRKTNINYAHSSKTIFTPVLYNFRVAPKPEFNKSFTLQQPFAILFDNLITVLWSVYGKNPITLIGANQLKWALELLKCFKADYGYPATIDRIVNELQDQLIELYAKIGTKLHENDEKLNQEKAIKLTEEKEELKENDHTIISMNDFESYNEVDIMSKLSEMKIPLDPVTGEITTLKELNALGKKKIITDPCYGDKKSTKFYMITALQKLLKKTTDASTKSGVEELIKDLRLDKILPKHTT